MSDAAPLLAAAALGAMLFFAVVVAPTVFKTLPEQIAGTLIRRLFPSYYLILALVTGLAALAAWGASDAVALALVCGAFVAARAWLMPRINAARDAGMGGDEAASITFRRLHGTSVVLNAAQMLALFVVAIRLV